MKQKILIYTLLSLFSASAVSLAMMESQRLGGGIATRHIGRGMGGDTRSDSANSRDSDISTAGIISGTVTKGPVFAATVKAFSIDKNGTKGQLIGIAQTDNQGRFAMDIGNYDGPMLIEAAGGHYVDEATGTEMDMLPGNILTCAIPFMEPGRRINGIQITPLTTIAQKTAQKMAGGMTVFNINRSHNAIGRYFDINDILFTPPMNAMVDGSGNTSDRDMRNYGMVLAGMSQYSYMQGVINSSDMITSMMDDASDGHMNGIAGEFPTMLGGNMLMPIDAGTVGLAEGMIAFIRSPMNMSGIGIEDMQMLIDKLVSSGGSILQHDSYPFLKTVFKKYRRVNIP